MQLMLNFTSYLHKSCIVTFTDSNARCIVRVYDTVSILKTTPVLVECGTGACQTFEESFKNEPLFGSSVPFISTVGHSNFHCQDRISSKIPSALSEKYLYHFESHLTESGPVQNGSDAKHFLGCNRSCTVRLSE
jgi:hypothetical protein